MESMWNPFIVTASDDADRLSTLKANHEWAHVNPVNHRVTHTHSEGPTFIWNAGGNWYDLEELQQHIDKDHPVIAGRDY